MTKRPDVYTTLGQECGCCGHRHPTVREAGRCLEDHRRREYSDISDPAAQSACTVIGSKDSALAPVRWLCVDSGTRSIG